MTATATATNMIDSGTSSTSRRRPATKRASPSQGAVVVVRGRAREARKAWHQDAQRKGVNAPDQHTDEHRSADERIAPASVQQARPADEQVRPAASNRRARTPGTSATQ